MDPNSAATEENSCWQIRLYGQFSLTDPDGVPVKLPYAGLEGLLAIFAVNRGVEMSRSSIAETLWPGDSAKSFSNLRQALKRLKQSLGEDSVTASRTHCSLSRSFTFASDYENPSLRRGDLFMPGHEGEWFDDVRFEGDLSESDSEETLSAVTHFVELLNWYRDHDTAKMGMLMRTDIDLIRVLPVEQVREMVKRLPATEHSSGWRYFWEAIVVVPTACRIALLVKAAEAGRRMGDYRLVYEALWEAVGENIISGHIDSAVKTAKACADVASANPALNMSARTNLHRGLIHLHCGESQLGLDYMREAEKAISDPVTLARRKAIRSFMEASVGNLHEGEECLFQTNEILKTLPQPSIVIVSELAQLALTAVRDRERLVCVEGPNFLNKWERDGHPHMKLYARELIAAAAQKIGNTPVVQQNLREASSLRSYAQMGYTAWDRARLSRCAGALN